MSNSAKPRFARWVIAHGTMGAPERNWFPWLTWQGVRAGVQVRVPRLPTPQGQSYDSWAEAFEAQSGPIGPDTLLIGHSTGTPFLLQYLQRKGVRPGAAFFVSGFIEELSGERFPELKPLLETFLRFEFDGAALRKLCPEYRCFHGDDDDVVPLAKGQAVARLLGAPFVVIAGGRHLNTEAERFEFPELLGAIHGNERSGTRLP